ncbi:Phosphatidylinositol:ceramide inositolphosphotransferase 3 [Pelomyxa schiedti]|nr:Phosphatidylinositol:ceramide inositolphosphotransferase 3 [Pelomyxa schiedti]
MSMVDDGFVFVAYDSSRPNRQITRSRDHSTNLGTPPLGGEGASPPTIGGDHDLNGVLPPPPRRRHTSATANSNSNAPETVAEAVSAGRAQSHNQDHRGGWAVSHRRQQYDESGGEGDIEAPGDPDNEDYDDRGPVDHVSRAAAQATIATKFGGLCPHCHGDSPPEAAKERCRPQLGVAVLVVMFLLGPLDMGTWVKILVRVIAYFNPSVFTSGEYESDVATMQTFAFWISKIVLAGSMLAVLYQLVYFKRWGDELPYAKRFFWWWVALCSELLIENFFIWFVSYSYHSKYDLTIQGLQDNLALLLPDFFAKFGAFGDLISKYTWATATHFLLAILALAFSVLFSQVPYSALGMMSRFFATLTTTRIVRTIGFLVTVLPNPRVKCITKRFPINQQPPDGSSLWQMILAASTHLRGGGGCNDLIISGHCVFWASAPLMFGTFYTGPRPWAQIVTGILWVVVAQTSVRDILTHHHYSVDMLMAVVVTAACWKWTAWVYSPRAGLLLQRRPGAPRDPMPKWLMIPIVLSLIFAAVLVLVAKM